MADCEIESHEKSNHNNYKNTPGSNYHGSDDKNRTTKKNCRTHDAMKSRYRQHSVAILIVITACLPQFMVGYSIGFSSPSTRDFEELDEYPNLTLDQITWFGSLLTLFAMLGSLTCGAIMDAIGRRLTIIATLTIMLVGWMFIFLSTAIYLLFIGRCLTGIALGMSIAVVPIYLGEVGPTFMRGMLGTLTNLLLSIGILICFVLGGSFRWRSLAEIGGIVASISIVCCYLLPESPYWLVKHGDTARAFCSFRILNNTESKEAINMKINTIKEFTENQSEAFRMTDLMKPMYLKPLIIVVVLNASQHFCGINAVMFYAHSIFTMVNFYDENMASILVGLVQVFCMVTVLPLMDKLGRRKLMLISCIGVVCCHVILGTCMHFIDPKQHYIDYHTSKMNVTKSLLTGTNNIHEVNHTSFHNASSQHVTALPDLSDLQVNANTTPATAWIALVSTLLFISFFAVGLGPIPFIAVGEMLPLQAKGLTGGIATSVNCLSAFIVIKSFPFLITILSSSIVFWGYGVFSLASAIFVWVRMPETKGKTLFEIQSIFDSDKRSADNVTEGDSAIKKSLIQQGDTSMTAL